MRHRTPEDMTAEIVVRAIILCAVLAGVLWLAK